jgi:hypothetical protein
MIARADLLTVDSSAHQDEHAIEVVLPFLQYAQKDLTIVPIITAHAALTAYKELGEKLADAVRALDLGDTTMFIASSDLTHYEPEAIARKKDTCAIEAILKLDEDSLFHEVRAKDISMCGYAPVIIMLSACKRLGAMTAELVRYATSGDATGDHARVVGYAGISIS